MNDHFTQKAEDYLSTLCLKMPGRSVGRRANQQAAAFFEKTARDLGWEIEIQSFPCLDWRAGSVTLQAGPEQFQVHPGPYSLGCEVDAELMAASTLKELEQAQPAGKLLLLDGELAKEQFMPKNFVFYNPEEHQEIYRLLEAKRPAAVVAATGKCPGLAGGAYPFPLFEDGDFDIPNVYMTDDEGARLRRLVGRSVRLAFESQRILSTGCNVIASNGALRSRRVVVCAHIDTKDNTPGALDNGTGVVTLLLLAELLREYTGSTRVELTALNGEDYYAASGQMKYLETNQDRFGEILLAINLDGAGYKIGRSAYSFYETSPELEKTVRTVFQPDPELQPGDPWPQGDHMLFAMNRTSAIAITSAGLTPELAAEITHTPKDTPNLVDCGKLAAIAWSLSALIEQLNAAQEARL